MAGMYSWFVWLVYPEQTLVGDTLRLTEAALDGGQPPGPGFGPSGDTTPCKVIPVILHGVDTIPCRMTGVTLHGVVSPESFLPAQNARSHLVFPKPETRNSKP